MNRGILKKHLAKGLFVVGNDRGLHTRPSTEIVKCASAFKSEVKLIHKKTEVNAKSLLGILMLAAAKGSKIGIVAEGVDAEAAVKSLVDLAQNKFNIHY
jgi:phosphocarrier protein HPr